MAIHLVRHPPTLIGKEYCVGHTDVDIDLAACRSIAQRLQTALPAGTRLYASTLTRARLLADAMCEHATHLHYCIDSRLCEMHFGHWEGRCWDEIDRAEVEHWNADRVFYRPGQGESVHMLVQRVAAIIQAWDKGSESVVAITHAGVIRAALALREARSLEAAARQATASRLDLPYGGVWTFEHGAFDF